MKNTGMKLVTTVISRGREFYILYDYEGKNICGDQKHYWGIESNLFGEDGHLVREINGCEGHLSKTVSECVESIRQTIEIDYIVESKGCTVMEAIEIFFTEKLGKEVETA